MKVHGRVLYLTESADTLRRQLNGTDLGLAGADEPLQYGVNTDGMISGAACTLGYTKEILGPHFLQDFKEVVAEGEIGHGGFDVIVGGEAYGSGSSREAAVVAHQGCGIQLVVAKSLQRIFQENLVYCGLPFTTNFDILKQIADTGEVDVGALHAELPPFFRAVAEAGGLLHYGAALLDGKVTPTYSTERHTKAMTCVEKIIAKTAWSGGDGRGLASVEPGDQVLCEAQFRGMHEYTTGMCMALYEEVFGDEPIERPETVAAFEDHFVLLPNKAVPESVRERRLAPALKLRDEMLDAGEKYGLRIHGPDRAYAAGVCHRVVLEQYAEPGTIVVLTDSHTPTAGVMNTFAFGVGSTAMSFALRTGLIPVTVPKTIRVVVEGEATAGLSPKDLILHLIGSPYLREEQWRENPTETCVLQFGGPGLEQWNVDELSVLTNMTVEGGLMTGIVEPCDAVREFFKTTRGREAEGFVDADEGAEYAHTIRVNLGDVPLTVATPGDSRNRMALADVGQVNVHNVVIASCTGGSLADLRAAHAVLKGRAIHEGVRLTVTPSSRAVADAAEAEGILADFRKLGAVVTHPGCGSCIGNGPGIPRPGETTVSTTNRNFDRRMGAPGPVYLASPAVAAAAAVEGELVDPRSL